MTCAKPDCFCCQQAYERIEKLKQDSLEEINVYRKLLRLPSLSSAQFRSTSDQHRPSSTVQITGPPSLTSLPPEILDRIVSFIDSDSIMQFCHSMPQLSHISKAIFEVGSAFPGFYSGPTLLWPDLEFPVGSLEKAERELDSEDEDADIFDYDDEYAPTEIPVRHILKIYTLSKILSRYNGSAVIVPSSVEYLDNLAPLLPKNIFIGENPEELPYNENFSDYLTKLVEIKTCIRMLHVPRVFQGYDDHEEMVLVAELLKSLPDLRGLAFSTEVPDEIVDVLPELEKLGELHVGQMDRFPAEILPRCERLTHLCFMGVEKVEESVLDALLDVLPECEFLREVKFQSFALMTEDLEALVLRKERLMTIGWRDGPVDVEDLSLGSIWKRDK
ncbi:hypothetical protein HDU98_006479 [Podochytrium sp. JEL0797]|nr:hypothetical protein HDU98_006479 [Podochytrium sp. JEL0797]